MFFVISGFYMQMVLHEKYTPTKLGSRWWIRFYQARYFRLFPAYFACLVLTVLAAIFASHANHKLFAPLSAWSAMASLEQSLSNFALWGWAVFSNLTMLLQEFASVLAVRNGESVLTLNWSRTDFIVWDVLALPHGWSLGVELLFYLLAPFILNLTSRWLVFLFVLGLIVKIGAVSLLGGYWNIRLLPFFLVNFMAGAMSYRFGQSFRYPAWVAFVLLFAVVLVLPSLFDDAELSWVSLALAAIAIPVAFQATKGSAYDSFIGELSYPFYVFHLLCLAITSFIIQRFGIHTKGAVLAAVALALTIIVSIVVFKIESRFLEPWRKRFGQG